MPRDTATIDRLIDALPHARAAASSDYDLSGPVSQRDGPLTEAAVLVALMEREAGWHVILTRRTAALKHHPGQVAFPGGKRDAGDGSLEETALREAEEEIGLARGLVEVLGSAGQHETVTGFAVTPVLGRVVQGFVPRPEPGEVERVFEVPLAVLMDAGRARVEARRWRGMERKYYVLPFGPFYIWGATARMIVALRRAWEAAR